MARVFISYRRADGQYAVGWIEERLRQLDEVTDLRTAFRDSDLRHGDDFPARLAREVEQCDVLIAVIGPKWAGVTGNGPPRILDPADWVGREITSALREGKRIIPVLLSGTEPVQANELPPEHRGFADLHALRFDVAEDLDVLVDDLRSHLDDLDRERAKTAGLDEPIVLPSARPSLLVWVLAVVAGVLGAVVGWLSIKIGGDADNPAWARMSTVQPAVYAGLFVFGFHHYRNSLSGVIEIRWRAVAKTSGLAAVLIALTVIAFAPGAKNQVARTLVQAFIAVSLMSPWIVMLLSAGWTRTTPEAIGARAKVLALQRRALAISAPAAVIALTPAILTTAALTNADGLIVGEASTLIALGIFLSLMLGVSLEYGHASLRHDSDLIRGEIADLSVVHRRHADAVLVHGRADLWSSLMWWAAGPTLVALGAAIYGWAA